MKKLAGVTWAWNAISQDYNIVETIKGLVEFCDNVSVLAGGDDGTFEMLTTVDLGIPDSMIGKVFINKISQSDWDAQQGREKLAYFQNRAVEWVRNACEWYILVQADEVVHPSSYEAIKNAINTGEEGFYVTRVNMWGDCYHKLNVPENRSPVGTRIIRLARTFYPSVDDGESQLCDARDHFINDIKIIHYGFIRDPKKHLVKIKHIQDDVFQIPHDKRIDGMEEFDASKMGFTKSDLVETNEAWIPVMAEWLRKRYNPLKSVETWEK